MCLDSVPSPTRNISQKSVIKPVHLVLLLFLPQIVESVILSGATDSFARFPKWAQTFENQLSLEFKTRTDSCLLLYTDDGGVQGNFYSLTIVEGRLHLDFRLGDSNQDVLIERPVNSIRVDQTRVDDGKWHKFVLFQAWENVKVQLDDTVVFKILTQRSFVFGTLKSNSDVFVGGLPNDVHQLGQMSSPLRRHTKRFAGSVKNLIYRLYPQGVSSPQMIGSKGTRLTDDDYCSHGTPCKNDGRCYSTNDGATCDCSFTEFEGVMCDKKKPAAALSFFGHEWIGYDVTNFTSALVQNRFENISIQFRTAHPNGLIFTAGDRSGHVQLVIERGILIASSKLFGTEKRIIRMFNKQNHPARFDDDQWHEVTLFRDVQLMRLTVDGHADEVKQFSGDTEWLGNSFAYVGGSLPHRSYIPGYSQPFRGCMKKIKYEADAQLLDVIELADQGFGQSVIRTGGDLSFSCQAGRLSPAPDVLSFNSGMYPVALPKWNSPSGGSIGFQFRTGSSDALILYHGTKRQHNQTHGDYIAFEISDGHLYLVLNLGSGVVRLQATAQRVDDPRVWHSVQLERLGRSGTVMVDHFKTDFSTPGVSANLHVEEPIFIGAVPWRDYDTPTTVWSSQLKKGFVGCLKNVRVNGMNSQINKFFSEKYSNVSLNDDITIGCPSLSGSDYCAADPCLNGAMCKNGHVTYHCDCAKTHFEGKRCNDDPVVISFARRHGDGPRIRLPQQRFSQTEDIDIKFRTEDDRAVLLDTASANTTDRFRLSLDRGRLQLRLSINGSRQNYGWGENLNDNQWHSVRINRRGEQLKLFVDGKWENHYTLPDGQINLFIDEISVAEPLQTYDGDSEETLDNDDFAGDMIKASFNYLDLLEDMKVKQRDRTSSEERPQGQRLKHRKVKSSTIWFDSVDGHLTFPVFRNSTKHGFKLVLKFRTLSPEALLAVVSNENDAAPEVIAVQLLEGSLRLTRISGKQLLTAVIRGRAFNDLRWHTLHVSEMEDGRVQLTVENRTTAIGGHLSRFQDAGKLYVGGLPKDTKWPSGLIPSQGFRGCMASLKLGTEPLDLWSDAETGTQVERGCRAPPSRCSADTCKNQGVCQQSWTSVNCDCSTTPFSGGYCDELGTTFEFDGDDTCIYYEYLQNQKPSTSSDVLVLAFQTEQSNGVLLSVQCGVDGDFFTVYLGGGHLRVKYSLGNQPHYLQLPEDNLHDGRWHTLKLRRRAANVTVQLDNKVPVKYYPKDGLATLNTQWRVSVGAAFNSLHSSAGQGRRKRRRHVRLFDEFKGKIAGVNFNGIRVLDLYANGGESVFGIGRPKLVHMAATSQPFDSGLFSRVEPLGDGFFSAGPLDCLAGEERSDCIIQDSADNGFFTPIVPQILSATHRPTTTRRLTTAVESVASSTTRRFTTTAPEVLTTSTAGPLRKDLLYLEPPETTLFAEVIIENSGPAPTFEVITRMPPTTQNDLSLYAVRPTTPMGPLLTSTRPYALGDTADFPRTSMILIASGLVIAIISIIVFWVFCCRQQSSQNSSDAKPPPSAIAAGYAPIPSDASPPETRFQPNLTGMPVMNGGLHMNGHCNTTGSNGKPMSMPTMNGVNATAPLLVSSQAPPERKKDFKEWYV